MPEDYETLLAILDDAVKQQRERAQMMLGKIRYEDAHYPIGPSDPIEAIKFCMEQHGLTPRDLEPYIGSSGRVSEVLKRKRKLSLRMIKRLHEGLKIPYESLMNEVA